MTSVFSKSIALLMASATVLAACSSTPTDLHGLPADETARAILCVQSTAIFTSAGEMAKADKAEMDRRKALLAEISSATDFVSLAEKAGKTPESVLGALEPVVTGGNWLGNVNACKAAYNLGDAEATPTLPKEPLAKAAACSAAVLLANNKGAKVDAKTNFMADPQAFYFLARTASTAGKGGLSRAQEQTSSQMSAVVSGGAVGPMAEQCIKEFPKAALGQTLTLPKEGNLRYSVCIVAVGASKESKDAAVIAKAKDVEARLKSKPDALKDALSTPRFDETQVLKAVADLGPSTDMLTACDKAYPG